MKEKRENYMKEARTESRLLGVGGKDSDIKLVKRELENLRREKMLKLVIL